VVTPLVEKKWCLNGDSMGFHGVLMGFNETVW
jgi:hypothetical protein